MTTEPATRARLYVVRHADAGVRLDSPDDHLRPLTVEGLERARVLAVLLHDGADGEIVSSPFRRCVETVEPLAYRRGREVVTRSELAEGVDVAGVLNLLRSLPDGSVVCTHGDVLVKLAAELGDARDRSDTAIPFDKGVAWVLLREDVSLSLVDEIGPSSGPARRHERIPHECSASSAHSRPDG